MLRLRFAPPHLFSFSPFLMHFHLFRSHFVDFIMQSETISVWVDDANAIRYFHCTRNFTDNNNKYIKFFLFFFFSLSLYFESAMLQSFFPLYSLVCFWNNPKIYRLLQKCWYLRDIYLPKKLLSLSANLSELAWHFYQQARIARREGFLSLRIISLLP